MLGSLNGETRLMRNMLIGSELLLNIIEPAAPGPHQILCLPNVISQLSKVIPRYASRRVKRLMLLNGRAGGSGMSWVIEITWRAVLVIAGDEGPYWYSPLKYATMLPSVAPPENPVTLFKPCS